MSVAPMNFTAALPEMFVLGGACVALLAELFLGQRVKNIAYTLVQVAVLGGLVFTLGQWGSARVVAFSGLYVSDDIAHILKLFITLTTFGAFVYSRHYVRDHNMPRGEYYILGLFSMLGMMVLVSGHSLITIYLGLELLSLPLYAMVAIKRHSRVSSEAAMKYFVMGSVASAMLLYGMSMLYGATGSLELSQIAQAVVQTPKAQQLILIFGLVFIVAGFGFKLAAVPFHMWAPDVYSGAPTSVTLFLGTAPKLAALGMVLRLLVFALPALFKQWQQLLIVLAIFSMGAGNLLAIAQSNIKRMLAYSAIAHVGFLLLGLIAGTRAGYSASLFYVLIYSLMSLGGFGLLVLLSRAGVEIENITDLTGLNTRNPWFAFLMLLVMLSMAGIPPTAGFFAKLLVIKALIDIHLVWLAVLAMVFAIVGVFYYLRIVKTMYFDAPGEPRTISVPLDMRIVFSVNAGALLILGIFPGGLLQYCLQAFGAV